MFVGVGNFEIIFEVVVLFEASNESGLNPSYGIDDGAPWFEFCPGTPRLSAIKKLIMYVNTVIKIMHKFLTDAKHWRAHIINSMCILVFMRERTARQTKTRRHHWKQRVMY